MKKIIRSILIILSILSLISSVFAEPIKVLVDNTKLDLPVEPVIVDARTLVPLRAIFEAMGASVKWDQETKTVTGMQANKIIKLQIDNKSAQVGGKKVALDSPARIINGSTLVPVRFIAESLDPTYSHPGQIADYNLIWFESIEDARAQGYKPCDYCFR